MRYSELRRLFLQLAATAAPVPLGIVACGGAVTTGESQQSDSDGGIQGTGAEPGAGGSTEEGVGGYPVYVGTGGYPNYMGGTGGYPTFVGQPAGGHPNYMGTGGMPPTGGYPSYMGMGGVPAGGTSPGGAATGGAWPVRDGGVAVADASPCNDPYYNGCGPSFCVELPRYDSGTPDCYSVCGASMTCDLIDDGLTFTVRCRSLCFGGRRPAGLPPPEDAFGSSLRKYFEEMARLESASVPAFRRLAHELSFHGAPRSLLRAARRAALDEIRHTRMGRTLAERFGGRYTPPRVPRQPLRSVEDIALDNAVEGCVRETFGAMIATYQARAAADPVVRRIMRRVAIDETRHAALAQEVARWTERRLTADARRRVAEARREAATAVLRELEAEPSAELARVAGLPQGAEARRIARVMLERIWAA